MSVNRGGRHWSPAFSLTWIVFLLPITAILFALRKPIRDNSYLWHVAAGTHQIGLGSVATADPFTFTVSGEPWRTQSWLMELAYGWFERFSPLASAHWTVAVSAIILLLSVGLRVSSGRRLLGALGVLWVMWLTFGYFTPRPVFPSLALFALVALVVSRARLRWILPLLFWLWASIHGGFVVGLGFLVLECLRRKEYRYLVDAGLAMLVSMFTAHGWGVWQTLVDFARSGENLDLISEWRPPDLISPALAPFLVGLVMLVALGILQRIRKEDLWVIAPFLVFSFSANRAIPLAAIALVPFVFPPNSLRLGNAPLARPAFVAAIAAIVVLPLLLPTGNQEFNDLFPVEAAKQLDNAPTFHNDSIGGYLIYAGFPYVFVDDRAELFGDLYLRFIDAVSARPGWEELFEEFGVDQVLLPNDATLAYWLEREGWRVRFRDPSFVILVSES